jgi:hypothetical protein
LDLLRQNQKLLTQCVCLLKFRLCDIITTESIQYLGKPLGVFQELTELLSAEVGLFHLGSGEAFRGNQRCPEGNMHIHCVLGTLRRLRQYLE